MWCPLQVFTTTLHRPYYALFRSSCITSSTNSKQKNLSGLTNLIFEDHLHRVFETLHRPLEPTCASLIQSCTGPWLSLKPTLHRSLETLCRSCPPPCTGLIWPCVGPLAQDLNLVIPWCILSPIRLDHRLAFNLLRLLSICSQNSTKTPLFSIFSQNHT